MKKVLLILALVAVYGISISNVSAKVITVEKTDITIVADSGSNSIVSFNNDEDPPKKKAEAAKPCCDEKTAAKAEAAKPCCGEKTATKAACPEAAKKSCGEAEKAACGEKK